jgi:hypothetical protein
LEDLYSSCGCIVKKENSKKIRATVTTRQGFRGVTEAFACKEITNFSSMYFSRVNNVNAHTTQYHVVRDILLSELSIFQLKGKGVGAPSTHYVTDKEWNYSILYMYTNMENVQPYFEKFDKIYWTTRE